MCLIRITKREESKNWAEAVLEEIIAKSIPKIQGSLWSPSRINTKKPIPEHIVLRKTENWKQKTNKQNLKTREKGLISYKEATKFLNADF